MNGGLLNFSDDDFINAPKAQPVCENTPTKPDTRINDEVKKKGKIKLNFNSLSEFRIYPDEIANFNPVWLIDDFLMEQSITTIYATGGSGKSFLALVLGVWLLDAQKINRLIYLDGDNGYTTLKHRRVDEILKTYSKIEYYPLFKQNSEGQSIDRYSGLSDLAENLAPNELKGTLVIIDSIRDFIKGDLGSDSVVMPYLNSLKAFRDNGATVIFLHHQPKQSKNPDENNEAYKGATAFIDSVDTAYFLSNKTNDQDKSEGKLAVTLKPTKARNGAEHKAFIINGANFKLVQADYYKYALTDKERYTLELALQIIKDNRMGIIQSDLAREIKSLAKAQAVEVLSNNALWEFLKRYDEKEYIIIKGARNSNIYKLIDENANTINPMPYNAVEAYEFKE